MLKFGSMSNNTYLCHDKPIINQHIMLKRILLAAVVGIAGAGLASAKVIESPAYDFRTGGCLKVARVEQTGDATRLTFSAKYKPGWWIQVDTVDVAITLPDDTVQIQPLTIEGDLTFGEKYVMPESGEAFFTVTYPPLPGSVKKIDTGASNKWAAIFGIDLTGKKKPANKGEETVVTTPYRPIATIFATDTITLSGKIKNYDPRMGINVMELVISDEAIGRTLPVAIPVKPDGSFRRRFFLPMAQMPTLKVNVYRLSFRVYLEPGNDLEILIDYDKLLDAGVGAAKKADAVTFGGSLGEINSELIASPMDMATPISHIIAEDKTPDEAKRMIIDHHAANASGVESYIADRKVSPKAAALLRNSVLSERTRDLLDYADYKYTGPLLPESFYVDFLKEVFSADSTLLACDAFFLLNRLGFTNVLPIYRYDINVEMLRPAIDFFAENGIELTDGEKKLIRRVADLGSPDSMQVCTYADFYDMRNALFSAAQRGDKAQEYRDKGFFSTPIFTERSETNREFIQRITGKEELPLVWQFAVTAREGRNNAENFLPEMTASHGITNRYLIDRMTEASKPMAGARKLPHTEAGNFMESLIEPYRGKYLLVDFWDITCGPCRYGIESNKERRERHHGNPGFSFLFLASEKGSPLELYDRYVETNLKEEDVKRLPEEEMILLRELFEFNGIPRYVLFNPEGEVMNSNYDMWDFWQLLKEKGIIDDADVN